MVLHWAAGKLAVCCCTISQAFGSSTSLHSFDASSSQSLRICASLVLVTARPAMPALQASGGMISVAVLNEPQAGELTPVWAQIFSAYSWHGSADFDV